MAYEGEKKLTFTTTSDHTSWGNVYAQFMQKTDKIAASGEGLKVKREMVMPKEGLKVGDRVEKGDMLGYFLFGGSDFVIVFQKKAAFELQSPKAADGNYQHILMGEKLGTMTAKANEQLQ